MAFSENVPHQPFQRSSASELPGELSMTIAFVGAGTPIFGFNTTITPVAPTDVAGTGLILVTAELAGSDTISTPAGWTQLDASAGMGQCRSFGLIATGSDTMPSFTWGNQWAFAIVLAFSGLDSSFSAAFAAAGRQTNQTTNIAAPVVSRTPTQNGSLALFYGQRNKTSASDGTTYTAPSNFTMGASGQHNGASVSFGISYWIQGTATTVAANLTMAGSASDSTAQPCQGIYLGILPAASIIVPRPPLTQGGMNVQVCQ
jgi:hypothetical protein